MREGLPGDRFRPSPRSPFIRHPVGAVREPPCFGDEGNKTELKAEYPKRIVEWVDVGVNTCRLTVLPPNPPDNRLNLLLEAVDQFAVGLDQSLLGFDFGDDGLLGFERGEGDVISS